MKTGMVDKLKGDIPVKLGVRMEMSGPKSWEALASTCRLHRSLDGCLKFWRSGQSRSVRATVDNLVEI